VSPFLLVLVVIQDSETRSFVKRAFESAGHRVVDTKGCRQGHILLNNGLCPDRVLIDCAATDSSENSEYYELVKSAPAAKTWLVMGTDGQRLRRESAEFGIDHFLTRPVTSEDIESVVGKSNPNPTHVTVSPGGLSLDSETHKCEIDRPTDTSAHPYIEELGDGSFFLAASPAMLEIHRQVKLLAGVDVNVLILGESGTGKEVIAHLIHRNSQRHREKFLKVNCAALPGDLLESELFGYRQGAFTGAIKDRPGKFEQASGGTLLLDEIGEMSVPMQAKLLHVLQDGEFTRLGGQQCTKVDVRVLAATNVPIEAALAEKSFREDLYYRLSVFTIAVPPLRERREEIPYLIDETIRRASVELKDLKGEKFPARIIDAAFLYDWPGNVRELRNFVTRAIIMRDPDAALRELETKTAAAGGTSGQISSRGEVSHGSGMKSIVRDVKERAEVRMIQDALEVSGWNRRHAARSLNISYRALLYKIQQHRLTPRGTKSLKEASHSNYSALGNRT